MKIMKIASGIKLLQHVPGSGEPAQKGDSVIYNVRFYLQRGDEVTLDAEIIARARGHVTTSIVDGVVLIDHQTTLGKRQTIAGVEKSLIGMQPGGYRKVLVSPHLAYGDKGIEGRIPENSALTIEIWLREIYRNGS